MSVLLNLNPDPRHSTPWVAREKKACPYSDIDFHFLICDHYVKTFELDTDLPSHFCSLIVLLISLGHLINHTGED